MKINNQTIRYRLVIREDMLFRGFARLAAGEATMIWGQILRSYHRQGCDLIVRALSYSHSLPSGSQFSPLVDWLVIHAADGSDQATIMARLQASDVRFGQLMVYFQPGLGDKLDQWIGAIAQQQNIQPLNAIQLVGPGLKRIRRGRSRSSMPDPNGLKPKSKIDYWSRLRGAIGADIFARFRRNEIVLIGCGRLGSLMAAKLVRMGLKRITLVDPDILQPHNRDITVGNRPSDVGGSKSIILAKSLHRIRPNARITAIDKSVQDEAVLELIRRAPVVVTCVDNDQSRRYVARTAAELLRIHLDIGTIVASTSNKLAAGSGETDRIIAADIRLMLPGACLACIGGLRDTQTSDINADFSWNSGGRIGSLPSINSIAVGAAIQIYLDFLAERITHSFWQRISWNDTEGIAASASLVSGDPECSICHFKTSE